MAERQVDSACGPGKQFHNSNNSHVGKNVMKCATGPSLCSITLSFSLPPSLSLSLFHSFLHSSFLHSFLLNTLTCLQSPRSPRGNSPKGCANSHVTLSNATTADTIYSGTIKTSTSTLESTPSFESSIQLPAVCVLHTVRTHQQGQEAARLWKGRSGLHAPGQMQPSH